MENFARIAEDSYGTAEEKMLAFSDSVEAAQNRVTDAIDAIALWVDGAEVMKDFYNAIAFAINNIGTLTVVVGGLIAILNKDKILSSVSNGLGRVGSGTIRAGDSLSKMFGFKEKEGTEKGFFENAWDIMKTGFQQGAQEDYLAALQKNIKTLDEEDKARAASVATLLMNSSELDRNNYYAAMANELIPEQIAVEESKIVDGKAYSLQLKRQTAQGYETLTEEETLSLCKKLLAQETDEQRQKVLQAITSTNNLTLTQNEYSAVLESLTNAQKNSYNSQVKAAQQGYSATIGEGTKGGLGKATARGLSLGIGSILSDLVGGYAGSQIGSAFGDTGTIIGTVLGGGILQGVTSVLTSTSFTSMIASKFATIGPIAATALGSAFAPIAIPLLIGVGTALFSWWQGEAERAAEKAAEVFSEESKKYTSYVNTLNDVGTFDKYIKGVDRLGRNVSLTEEEYQKWLDSSNALAEVFPDLIQYTDDQGNAIVGLNGGVATLTDTINEMIDAQQRATDQALLDPTLFNANYNEAKKSWDTAKEGIEGTKEALDALNQGFTFTESEFEDGSIMSMFEGFFGGGDEATLETHTRETANLIKNILKEAGYDASTDSSTGTSVILKGVDPEKEEEVLSLVREKINEQMNGLENDMENASDSVSDQVNAMLREMGKGYFDNMLDFDYDSYGDSISKMFEDISDEEMQAIQNTISGMGLDSQAEDYAQTVVDTIKQIHQQIEENPAIMELYLDASEAETVGEQSQLRKQLENLLTATFGTDGWTEGEKQFAIQLRFVFDDEGNLQDSLNNYQTLLDRMQVNSLGTGVTENWVNSLDIEDWNQVFEYFTSGVVDASTSVQTLTNLLYADREPSDLEETFNKLANLMEIFPELEGRINTLYDTLYNSGYTGEESDFTKIITESLSDLPEEYRNAVEAGYGDFVDACKEMGAEGGDAIVNEMVNQLYDSNLTNSYEAYLADMTGELFPDLEIDGVVDSWSELQSMMESMLETYDAVSAAQEEYNQMGKLSVQTTLSLLSANAGYANALKVTESGIQLTNDANGVMLTLQQQLIAATIEQMIQDAKAQIEKNNLRIAEIQHGNAAASTAQTIVSGNNDAITSLDQLATAYKKAAPGAISIAAAENGDVETAIQYYNMIGTGASTTTAKAKYSGSKIRNDISGNILGYKADYKSSSATSGSKRDNSVSRGSYNEYGILITPEMQAEIDSLLEDNANQEAKIDLLQYMLDNPDTWKTTEAYSTPDLDTGSGSSGSGGGDDEIESAKKYLEELQELQNQINKEWEDMVAFANNTDSAYYGKMRLNLTAQLNEVNRLLENYDEYLAAGMLEESDYNDLMQQRIDLQVELNNLDDEQVQEAIDLLETQDASIVSLIEAQKQLVATSDTYEELVERQQELNNLLEQQRELQRDVYEFERDMAEMATEYVSGTAYSNSRIYEAMMSLQKQSVEQQMESLLDSYNTVIAQKMQQYSS